MNGAQDLGGMQGFGAVVAGTEEPVFKADWERRAFALTLAMGATGEWNLDMMRSARENRPASDYFAKSYFEIWFAGLVCMIFRGGLVSDEELVAGRSLQTCRPVKRVLAAQEVSEALCRGTPTKRPPTRPTRFKVGERVRARVMHPPHHTRLPRYVRGRAGVIERVHGCHVFADSHALGGGEDPQWLYTVCFSCAELWGADADPTGFVSVDAWEPYLESA